MTLALEEFNEMIKVKLRGQSFQKEAADIEVDEYALEAGVKSKKGHW